METHKIGIRWSLQGADQLGAEAFVPTFHAWIQQAALPDHLLIDVADYEHVQGGPGTVLISHEANLSIDRSGERPGLLYVRKQPIDGSLADRLRACLRYALLAAARLEQDLDVKTRTGDLSIILNDRLAAPNTPDTFERVRGDLQSVLDDLYGDAAELEHRHSPQRLFEVRVRPKSAPAATALLERLSTNSPTTPSR